MWLGPYRCRRNERAARRLPELPRLAGRAGAGRNTLAPLPKELEEPYLSYNVLQRAQGFDLEPCCGKTVERCTYTVKNHPSGKVCQADLYICGGEIVAGDILCTGEGGFIAPLAFPKDA